ncbi:DUF885 domain-containing protein [Rhodospirillum centenum]|uniref:Lipoprotein n=1 Tax=Rhodospirillum centenum (strain ATCC 51521 / SW) TaxID=414684 RepID=B6INB0_RHOCS|nr:DUF885 domain-containing protein [Rhodospirillum centenum]ACI99007.1 conserved hypothetical protein [Rhodospirillum centenum SW]
MAIRSSARALLAGAALTVLLALPPGLPAVAGTAATPAAAAATQKTAEDAKLDAFLEDAWNRVLARNPDLRVQLGMKDTEGRWTPVSDAFGEENEKLARGDLERLRKEIDRDALSSQGRLNYDLFTYVMEDGLSYAPFRYDSYAFTRLDGGHISMPSFLISTLQVQDKADAESYIRRLRGIGQVLADMEAAARVRLERGIAPPAFNFPSIVSASRAVAAGKPFDDGPNESPLWLDIRAKVGALSLDEAEKTRLIAEAEKALREEVGPAYRRFADAMEAMGAKVKENNGVWALPKGAELYRVAVRSSTTVDMDPAAIHELGLKEVARIQDEMRAIMRKVSFKGDLKAFFEYLKTDPRFFYPDTDEGQKAYMARATEVIGRMEAQLGRYFGVLPKARMEVRAVEKFREESSPGAFYQQPSLDGSRPGIFYANMADMKALPKWDLETLAYHEGIPGHHMQIAIAQELEGVPAFRRIWNTSAYAEGWALYAEHLGKEMGFFEDPYSDAGRLGAELFRAVRLVVDTGLHTKKWTREQAIAYMNENTPNAEIDNTREVERYMNWPGQALSYKVGMLEIQRLRAKAEATLGDRFDIRGFHDTVLANGAVPLPLLQQLVDSWVASRAKG